MKFQSTSKSNIHHLKELYKGRKTLSTASCFSFFWPNAIMALVLTQKRSFQQNKMKWPRYILWPLKTVFLVCARLGFSFYIFFFFLVLLALDRKDVLCVTLNSNGDTRIRLLNFPPTLFYKGGYSDFVLRIYPDSKCPISANIWDDGKKKCQLPTSLNWKFLLE